MAVFAAVPSRLCAGSFAERCFGSAMGSRSIDSPMQGARAVPRCRPLIGFATAFIPQFPRRFKPDPSRIAMGEYPRPSVIRVTWSPPGRASAGIIVTAVVLSAASFMTRPTWVRPGAVVAVKLPGPSRRRSASSTLRRRGASAARDFARRGPSSRGLVDRRCRARAAGHRGDAAR